VDAVVAHGGVVEKMCKGQRTIFLVSPPSSLFFGLIPIDEALIRGINDCGIILTTFLATPWCEAQNVVLFVGAYSRLFSVTCIVFFA